MKHTPPFGFGSQRTNNKNSQDDEFAALFVKASGLLIERVDNMEKRLTALMDKLEKAEKKPEAANTVNLIDG